MVPRTYGPQIFSKYMIPAAIQERNKHFQTLYATMNALAAYSVPRHGCSF